MDSTSIESLAYFIRKFQNKPVSDQNLEEFGMVCSLVQTCNLQDLQKLKEEYTSHFVQAVKLKSIHKDQERFKCSVIENSRRIAEKIRKSEMAKCIEPCVFLRISYLSFKSLILPLIEEDLDIKLFCLHRLQFMSVPIDDTRGSALKNSFLLLTT